MAMSTELGRSFVLHLLHGEGASVERIHLDNYSQRLESPAAPVRITENYKLIVELSACEEENGVVLQWDQLISQEETESEQTIVLSTASNRHILARGQEEYPWRCGLYQYRILFKGTTYYGTFEVVPRAFTGSQLKSIHDTLNQTLEGLVEDELVLKRAVSDSESLEHLASWRYFTWYKQVESQLLHAVRAIERNHDSELKLTYSVEATERRQTLKSVRWSVAGNGTRYAGTKTLNRRMELHSDSEPNRLIKYWLRSFHEIMEQVLSSLKIDFAELASLYDQLADGIEYDELKHQEMSRLKAVDKVYLDQSYNSIHGRKKNLIKMKRQMVALQRFEQQCRTDQSLLRKTLYSPFWHSVSDCVPQRMSIGKHHAYKVVFGIWKGAALWHGSGRSKWEDKFVPIVKPTALLYEYYVLFTAIKCLRMLGYWPNDHTIAEQLRASFHLGKLQEGTRVSLQQGSWLIELTYDEEIDNHEQAALEKQTGFFSTEPNRRPDIRIDLYETAHSGEKRYLSSLILEVKYRPMWNIYSTRGVTSTMLQMSRYFMIRHVHSDNGSRMYARTPVHNVVCVYPGHESNGLVLEAGCGSFLQLYPGDDGNAVGMDSLMDLLGQWIGSGRK